MKKSIILTVVTVLTLVLGITVSVASTSDPGSQTDPIVTKSYVDDKTSYTPISLTPGQKLIGGVGTEVILRSGEATAIGNASNGVSDITAGTDLMTGQPVGLNHLLLIPRADGRGIAATTDIWVMIRGTYSIQ